MFCRMDAADLGWLWHENRSDISEVRLQTGLLSIVHGPLPTKFMSQQHCNAVSVRHTVSAFRAPLMRTMMALTCWTVGQGARESSVW